MVSNQDIIDEAFKLFAKKGFAETSTEDIASALSIKKQTLYAHFRSKDDIIKGVLAEQSAIVVKEIRKLVEDLSSQVPEVFLKDVFEGLLTVFSDSDRLLLWKRVMLIDGHEAFRGIRDTMRGQFSKKFSESLFEVIRKSCPWISDSDFHSFFLSYMLLITGYLDWMSFGEINEMTREIGWNNFWRGTKEFFGYAGNGTQAAE